jgi:hypothetical protein
LRAAGIRSENVPDAMEVVSGFSAAADRRLRTVGRTDLGEIARLSCRMSEGPNRVLGKVTSDEP